MLTRLIMGIALSLVLVASASAATISGTITGPDGKPLDGVYLRYDGPDYDVAYTNAAGRYEFRNVDAGGYKLSIEPDEDSGLSPEYWDDQVEFESATTIDLDATEQFTADAQLTSGGIIKGKVTDPDGNPLSKITVTAFRADGRDPEDDAPPNATTGADGTYEIRTLLPREYVLEFESSGGGNWALEYFDDSQTFAQARRIAMARDATFSASAVLAPGGSITGTVTGAGKGALGGACVELLDADGALRRERRTRSDGKYELTGLLPGTYRLRFRGCASGTFADEFFTDKPTLAAADPVVVTAGGSLVADAELAAGGAGDTAPPDTSITGGPGDGTPTFAFTATETATFACAVDGAAFAGCTSPFVAGGLPAGEHTFAVRAVDAAGNLDASPATATFTVAAAPVGPSGPGTPPATAPADADGDGVPDATDPCPAQTGALAGGGCPAVLAVPAAPCDAAAAQAGLQRARAALTKATKRVAGARRALKRAKRTGRKVAARRRAVKKARAVADQRREQVTAASGALC